MVLPSGVRVCKEFQGKVLRRTRFRTLIRQGCYGLVVPEAQAGDLTCARRTGAVKPSNESTTCRTSDYPICYATNDGARPR